MFQALADICPLPEAPDSVAPATCVLTHEDRSSPGRWFWAAARWGPHGIEVALSSWLPHKSSAGRVEWPHNTPRQAAECAHYPVVDNTTHLIKPSGYSRLLSCEECRAPLIPGVKSLVCAHCFVRHGLDSKDASDESMGQLFQDYTELISTPPCSRCVFREPTEQIVACCTDPTCSAGPCQLMRGIVDHPINVRDLVQHVYTSVKANSALAKRGRAVAKSAQKCKHGRKRQCNMCGGNAVLQPSKESAMASRCGLTMHGVSCMLCHVMRSCHNIPHEMPHGIVAMCNMQHAIRQDEPS